MDYKHYSLHKKLADFNRLVVLLPFLILGLFFTRSCDVDDNDSAFNNNCLTGNGAIVTETRSVNDFQNVYHAGVAQIFLSRGPQEDLRIEAQRNVLDALETEVSNNTLTIEFNRCVNTIEDVKIYITIPEIRTLELVGVGSIEMQDDFELDELQVTLTGVGDFILRGIADMLSIDLLGVGDIHAFELVSDRCDIELLGVGDVEVFASDQLDIRITGNGNVFYKGDPIVNTTITGSGTVVDAN